MSSFWSGWIILLTVANIVAALWLLRVTAKSRPGEPAASETTGHRWDGDLAELNNPLPRWWLWLFYGTVAFSVLYLALYPGLGNFRGLLGWSQEGQFVAEVTQADERYGEFFARFADMDLLELGAQPEAMAAAGNIFGNRCAQCHGSDGGGASGFPDLTDAHWQWGGEPDTVLASITQGRTAMMPPMAGAIGGDDGVTGMIEYVRSLSGLDHDAQLAAQAQPLFAVCGACHGMDGGGNVAIGAPSLTDESWLYGSDRETLRRTISGGRESQMPAQSPGLDDTKLRVMAAYVLRLSGQAGGSAQ
jgi:cytochrome c oxidase cbb3-type subunit 3